MRLGADDVDVGSLSWRLGGVKGFIVVLDGDLRYAWYTWANVGEFWRIRKSHALRAEATNALFWSLMVNFLIGKGLYVCT